jgi:WD40 repeat protein
VALLTDSDTQERSGDPAGTPQYPDVFVSYSRRDEPFVRRLVGRLADHDKEAWVDWEDIPPTADWMDEIAVGIDGAASFVFVISPESVASKVCERELEYALEQGKRIVPLLLRDTDGTPVPDALASRNWISFREPDEFEPSFAKFVDALDTDLEWVRVHTRLLVRAGEWRQRERDASLLLRGGDLRAAEQWLARVEATAEPQPTPLQRQYVVSSRNAQTRRQRITIGAVVLALIVTAALAMLAWRQRNVAVSNEQEARSRELAASAISQLPADPELSVLLAREAVRTRTTPQATTALRLALAQSHAERRLPTVGAAAGDVELSADGRLAVTAGSDRITRIWDFAHGRLITTLPRERNPCPYPSGQGPPCDVTGSSLLAVFDRAGKLVATAGAAGDVSVWNWRTRRRVARFRTATSSLAFSPDGRYLLTADDDFFDGASRIWDWSTGKVVATLSDPPDRLGRGLSSARFSDDGRLVVTASAAGHARVWSWPRERVLVTLPQEELGDASFDRSGTFLVTAGDDGVARVWRWRSRRVVATLRGHTDAVVAATFNSRGDLVLTVSADGTARVWDWRRELDEAQLRGHRGGVFAGTFTPDGTRAVTAGVDGTTRVWTRLTHRSLARLAPTAPKGSVAFLASAEISRDDARVLTGGLEPGRPPIARVWDWRRDRTIYSYEERNANESGEAGPQLRASFAPRGRGVLIASRDGGLVLWDPKTRARHRIAGPSVEAAKLDADGRVAVLADGAGVSVVDTRTEKVLGRWNRVDATDVAITPDGDKLAATGPSGLLLWRRTDARTGPPIGENASTVAFSPDGRLVVTAGRIPRIWDWRSRHVLAELPSPGGATAATFSADGDLVVTADLDRTTRVWAWNAEQIVDEFSPPTSSSPAGIAAPSAASLSADGALLVVANSDGAAYVFACDACRPIARLLDETCARVTRNLTFNEWQRYMGSSSYRKTCPDVQRQPG